MGRREQRAELQSTWMVMREPTQKYESRAQRRKNLAIARRAMRQLPPAAEESAQVPMRE